MKPFLELTEEVKKDHDYVFESNRGGFSIYNKLPIATRYICKRCNIICLVKEHEYKICIRINSNKSITGKLLVEHENLSCDEMIIKDIIE